MSNQQSYLDEQWEDLPLPDSDKAWEQMALLLDKEERKRILPPWFSCWFLTGLALLLLGGCLWYLLRSKDEGNETIHLSSKKEKTTVHKNVSPQEKKNVVRFEKARPLPNLSTNDSTALTKSKKSSRTLAIELIKTSGIKKSFPLKKRLKNERRNATQATSFQQSKHNHAKRQNNFFAGSKTKSSAMPIELVHLFEQEISTPVITQIAWLKIIRQSDSNKRAKPVEDSSEKKKIAKDSKLHWNIGIGLQQAILLNGQETSAFNYNGKSALFSDHVPLLIVGVKKDRWLAQVVLQPNLPQPVRRFNLDENTTYDSLTQTVNTDRLRLQKLYYHQASLSIGYALTNKWTIAVGASVNLLAGAVLEAEHEQTFLPTGSQTLTKSRHTIKGDDSLLKKTTAGLLLETAYQWKRFSIGLRYAQDVMTYFNRNFFDEKNRLLQASLRFQLWKK